MNATAADADADAVPSMRIAERPIAESLASDPHAGHPA